MVRQIFFYTLSQPYDDYAIISSIRVHHDEQPIHLGELIWFHLRLLFKRCFGEPHG